MGGDRDQASSFAATLALAVIVFSFTSPFFGATVAAQTIGSYVIDPALDIHILIAPGLWYRFSQDLAQMVASNLEDLGIQVETVMTYEWDTVDGRVLHPTSGLIGKTYEQGGFDVLLTSWRLGPDPNPYRYSHSSQFPPFGRNYYLWNSSLADMLAYNITSVMDPATQIQYIKSWQEIAYEALPSIALYYDDGIVAHRPNFNSTPFAVNYYPKWPGVEQWNFISSPLTSVTLAQTIDCNIFSPYHTIYVNYDTGYGPVFGELRAQGLLKRGLNASRMEPYMAYANFTMSPDGRNWTFWIRPGIKFHDGEELDARDVVYTNRYVMTPSWQSVSYWSLRGILGSNTSVYWAGESGTPGASNPYNKYEVHFDLPRPWAFFEQNIGGGTIYPASILLGLSGGIPDYSAWHPDPVKTAGFVSTSFVSGSGNDYLYYAKNGTPYTGSGPVGAGPYKWVDYDLAAETLHLKKFDGYFNRAALESTGAYGITDYYVRRIPDKDAAIAALRNNSVQVLDPLYDFFDSLDAFDPAWSRVVSFHGYGVAELGFNMRHPIWGTGVDTPLGQSDPGLAAEAAKHLRYAFEYLVPRTAMISDYLHGYGVPGLTTPIARSMLGFNYGISARNGSAPNAKTLAMSELVAAGYRIDKSPLTTLTQFLLSPVVIAVLVSALFLIGVGVIRRRRRSSHVSWSPESPPSRQDWGATAEGATRSPPARRPLATARTARPASVTISAVCSNCGSVSRQPDARYCMFCGESLPTGPGAVEAVGDRRRNTPKISECMVCNLEVDADDPVVWCPYCGNLAHRVHLLEWVHVKDYCPVCRRHLDGHDLVDL